MNELHVPSIAAGDRMACASLAMRFAENAGIERRAVKEIGVCVAELVSNVERYAEHGCLMVRIVDDDGTFLEIEVVDRGPGIADLGAARADGWSAGRMREPGEPVSRRSLGVGLGAVGRLMDRVSFESYPGRGTRVLARKRLR